jgi:hypothetical protein
MFHRRNSESPRVASARKAADEALLALRFSVATVS